MSAPTRRTEPAVRASRARTAETIFVISVIASLATPLAASASEPTLERLFASVVSGVEALTGGEVLPRYPDPAHPEGGEHCTSEDYCIGFIDELRIEAWGRNIDVMPSPRTPLRMLVDACIGLLGAFTPKGTAGDVEAFVLGSVSRLIDEGERTRTEFETFRFNMKLTAEDLPGCSIVRYVDR